ncbi:MAG: RNA polymerase sigma factor RpoD/SigA [Spirochaetota bacterium]|nr:MAG: RNA polymerase sigma factor RpoD/SigA [Spirochaetota bacterium]
MKRTHSDKNSVQIYLKQIENIPVLTREEEEVCAKKVTKGDRREKERLIVSNLRFVVSIAVRYQNLGLPLMDLINEGNMGLLRAVEKFDVSKGFKFISYARWWIRHFILKAIFEQSTSIKLPLKYATQLSKRDDTGDSETVQKLKKIYRPVSLDQKLSEDNNSDTIMDLVDDSKYDLPEKFAIEENLRELINEVMDKLKPIERDVINRHFGLNGRRPLTLKEIGERYNLTKERIRQIEHTALDKLKYPMRKRKIMDFVD